MRVTKFGYNERSANNAIANLTLFLIQHDLLVTQKYHANLQLAIDLMERWIVITMVVAHIEHMVMGPSPREPLCLKL